MRRLYALLGAVAALVLLLTPVAHAAGAAGDCREEPDPEMPGRGVTSWVVSEPDRLPPVGARFTRDGVPLYDQWGMAGMRWNNYDLGCGPDITNDPTAIIGTTVANWALEVSKFGVGVTDAVTRAAYHPTFLDVFNPLINNTVDTLHAVLFNKWAPVFLVLAGAVLLYKATRLRVASAATALAWAGLVLIAATVLFQWPVKAGNYVDGTVGATVGAVHNGINRTGSQDPASATTQSVYYAVLWQQWKAGTFGDANSAVARRYADDLFAAQSLTWREARVVQNDPDGRGEDIIEAKQQAFYDTANDIKDDDPDAYAYVTGHRSEARVGAAGVAGVAALCVLPLLFMAALLILASYLIVRLAVMLFPAVATIGLAYPFRGVVIGVATAAAAAVINCLVFAVGAAVNVLAIRILLSPDSRLPTWLGLILAALFALVMWFALKPFWRLTKMASPSHNVFNETSDSIRRTGSKVGDLAKTAAGAAVGGAAGAAVVNADDDDADEKPAAAKRARAEGYSAPDPAAAADTTPQSLAGGPAAAALALPPGAAPAAHATGPAPVAPLPEGGPTGPQQPAVAPGGGVATPALPGGPVPVHTPEETPALAATGGDHPEPLYPALPGRAHDPSVTNPDPGQPDQPDATPGEQPGAEAADTSAANTTAVPEDGGVYYTPAGEQVSGPQPESMVVVEPEITDDGEQVMVLYNADAPDQPEFETMQPEQEDAQR